MASIHPYLNFMGNTEEDGERMFNALSAGGYVEMPFDKAPWGAWFGMCNDKYGIKWMVNYYDNRSNSANGAQ